MECTTVGCEVTPVNVPQVCLSSGSELDPLLDASQTGIRCPSTRLTPAL